MEFHTEKQILLHVLGIKFPLDLVDTGKKLPIFYGLNLSRIIRRKLNECTLGSTYNE